MAIYITATTAGLMKGMRNRGDAAENIARFFGVDLAEVNAVLDGSMFRNVRAPLGVAIPVLKGTYVLWLARNALLMARSSIEVALKALDEVGGP